MITTVLTIYCNWTLRKKSLKERSQVHECKKIANASTSARSPYPTTHIFYSPSLFRAAFLTLTLTPILVPHSSRRTKLERDLTKSRNVKANLPCCKYTE